MTSKADADPAGHAAADLDLVDVVGLRSIGQLDRGSAGVQERYPAAVGRVVGGLLVQAEDVAVEAEARAS